MKLTLSLLSLLLCGQALLANNIEVTDVSIESLLPDQDLAYVSFDVSWDNSWRVSGAPANYDAAWIFVKFRASSGEWRHANILGAEAAADATVQLSGDQTGVFLYSDGNRMGSVDYQDVRLLWDYGAGGVDELALVTLSVVAIEMVYVNQGAFTLGYSQQPNAASTIGINSSGGGMLYPMNSEAPITVGTSAGNMYYGAAANGGGDVTGPIPVAFPKGVSAFYCMKYELTQGQYVDFYNTLTGAQKIAHNVTDSLGKNSQALVNRNGIYLESTGEAKTTTPHVAMNFVSASRAWAFLDWAALRPMSEFEFEKAARGPAPVVFNEYAWGSASLSGNTLTVLDPATASERFTGLATAAGIGNAVYSNNSLITTDGPARVGSIAGSVATNNRANTGAGYYGAMDLSGNLFELLVSIGDPTGRGFTGLHGDGDISGAVVGWPTATAGYGVRSGGYSFSATSMQVAVRNNMTYSNTAGIALIGFRGVRTAP